MDYIWLKQYQSALTVADARSGRWYSTPTIGLPVPVTTVAGLVALAVWLDSVPVLVLAWLITALMIPGLELA